MNEPPEYLVQAIRHAHHTGASTARPTGLAALNNQTSPGAQEPFPGIAYVLYAEADGTLVVGWDLEMETWSQGTGSPPQDPNGLGANNEFGLAICFSGQDPTEAQWSAVTKAHGVTETVCGHPLVLTGHRLVDPGTTDCPGDVAAARLWRPP